MKESKKRGREQLGKLMAKSRSQSVNLPSARPLMNPLTVLQVDASDYAFGGALTTQRQWKAATRCRHILQHEAHRTALLWNREGVPGTMQLFSEVWPVAIGQVWHSCTHRSSASQDHNEEAIEQGPSPSAKDADETAAISIQPTLQERTDTSPSRYTLSGSPSSANISKSNTLRCLPNRDGVWVEQQKPKTDNHLPEEKSKDVTLATLYKVIVHG